MFALTTATTKITALALSAFVTYSFIDSVALGFQNQSQTMQFVTLPTVTIVGHRTDLRQDTVQTAAKGDDKAPI